MPGLTAEDKPVLGGGDLAGIFAQDNESAQKLVQFLASADFGTHGVRRERQLDLPAHRLRRRALPDRDLEARSPQIAYESTDFVFDGSDQMPGEVGSGSFWREMTAWISGGQDADDDAGQHRGQLAGLSRRPGCRAARPPGTPVPVPVPSTRSDGSSP